MNFSVNSIREKWTDGYLHFLIFLESMYETIMSLLALLVLPFAFVYLFVSSWFTLVRTSQETDLLLTQAKAQIETFVQELSTSHHLPLVLPSLQVSYSLEREDWDAPSVGTKWTLHVSFLEKVTPEQSAKVRAEFQKRALHYWHTSDILISTIDTVQVNVFTNVL